MADTKIVLDKYADLIDQNRHHSYLGDNPKWSLVDGSIHYVYPLVSFSGNHELGVSLIYDSSMPDIVSEIFKGLPNGFKLTGCCAIKEVSDESGKDYLLFIDEDGFVHTFFKYSENGEDFYCDSEASGLFYEVSTQVFTDGYGLTLAFDDEGRLIRKNNNDRFVLEYVYDKDGYLTGIYDAVSRKRHVSLEYESGFLKSAKLMYDNTLITQAVFDYKKKLIPQFGMMIPYAIDEVSYMGLLPTSQVYSKLIVQYGEKSIKGDASVIGFLDYFRHEGFSFSKENGRINKLYLTAISNGSEEKTIIGSFENVKSEKNTILIKDTKGSIKAYMLDTKGNTVSTFRYEDELYFPVGEDKGVDLCLTGSLYGIGQYSYQTCDRGQPIRITSFKSKDNEQSIATLKLNEGYCLSMYVRLHSEQRGAAVACTGFRQAGLNPYAVGVWQKITLGIDKAIENCEQFSVSVTDDLGYAIAADISQPRVIQKSKPQFSSDLYNTLPSSRLFNGPDYVRGFVTEKDYLKTYSSLILSHGYLRFLWLNNGLDVIPITNIKISKNDSNEKISLLNYLENNPLAFYEKNSIDHIITETIFDHYSSEEMITIVNNKTFDEETLSTEQEIVSNTQKATIDKVNIAHVEKYSEDGLLVEKWIDDTCVEKREYDEDGNLIKVSTPYGFMEYTFENGLLHGIFDGLVFRELQYDDLARVKTILYPDSDELKISLKYSDQDLVGADDGVLSTSLVKDYIKQKEEYLLGEVKMEESIVDQDYLIRGYPGNEDMVTHYDEYSRIDFITNNVEGVRFSYGDSSTSTYSLDVHRIDDEFSGLITEIQYSNDGNVESKVVLYNDKIWTRIENVHSKCDAEYMVGPASIPYRRYMRYGDHQVEIGYDNPAHDLSMATSTTVYDTLGRTIKKEDSLIDYTFKYGDNSLLSCLSTDFFTEKLSYLDNNPRLYRLIHEGEIAIDDDYEYDCLGRLTSAIRTGDYPYHHQYHYCGFQLSYIEGTLDLQRDKLGRIESAIDVRNRFKYDYEYDESGNVVQYGHSRLTYMRGRRLATYECDGTKVSFEYSYNGIRTKKTVDDTIIFYYYHDNTLLGEDHSDGIKLRYFYDDDSVVGFTFEKPNQRKMYFGYIKNSRGDIIGLVDDQGYYVGGYIYDEKGLLLNVVPNKNISDSEYILKLNPLRYRSYYYDSETEFYYLINRYYNPLTLSFLTPDDSNELDYLVANGFDPYCYCLYDPVNKEDPTGKISVIVGFAIAGAVAGAAGYCISFVIVGFCTQDWTWSWCDFLCTVLSGAVNGILCYCGISSSMILNGLIEAARSTRSMCLQNIFEGTDYSWDEIVIQSIVSGFASACLSNKASKLQIKGVTAGRNSFKAITNNISKRAMKGLVSNITAKSVAKIAIYQIVDDLIYTFESAYMEVYIRATYPEYEKKLLEVM